MSKPKLGVDARNVWAGVLFARAGKTICLAGPLAARERSSGLSEGPPKRRVGLDWLRAPN